MVPAGIVGALLSSFGDPRSSVVPRSLGDPRSLVVPRWSPAGMSIAASPGDALFEHVLPKSVVRRSANSLDVTRIGFLPFQELSP
jgi:hypothetical protein